MDYPLFKKLKQWRQEKADSLGWPIYKILKNASLEGLATSKPRNERDLFGISGIGAVNGRKYGKELLRIVAMHEGRSVTQKEESKLFRGVPTSKENHGKRWDHADLLRLGELYKERCSLKQMAILLGRSEFAIEKKMEELGWSI